MYQTRSFNKKMNVWYAYEVEYVWDELKQKKIQKRRCIGKIDPVTDQIIPNGKRGPGRINANSSNGVSDTVAGNNQEISGIDKSAESEQLEKSEGSCISKRKLEAKIHKLVRTMDMISQQMAVLARDLRSLTEEDDSDDEDEKENENENGKRIS